MQIMLEAPKRELQERSIRSVMNAKVSALKDPGGNAQVVAEAQQRHSELQQRLEAYTALRQQDVDDINFKVCILFSPGHQVPWQVKCHNQSVQSQHIGDADFA
jgi:hypothetical protein